MLEKRVPVRTVTPTSTQTHTQHKTYAEFHVILRVIKVQLNTFQLETQKGDWTEKYKLVNNLATKIQDWMKRTSVTTTFIEEANELLTKSRENSKKFGQWIRNADPQFDMHFQGK